jgi:hypothetical protein
MTAIPTINDVLWHGGMESQIINRQDGLESDILLSLTPDVSRRVGWAQPIKGLGGVSKYISSSITD